MIEGDGVGEFDCFDGSNAKSTSQLTRRKGSDFYRRIVAVEYVVLNATHRYRQERFGIGRQDEVSAFHESRRECHGGRRCATRLEIAQQVQIDRVIAVTQRSGYFN